MGADRTPFQLKLPAGKRNENLKRDFIANENILLSGSLVTWGEYWNTAFDMGVFLKLPNQIRMERLRNREIGRYGEKLKTDNEIKARSEAFLQWADNYEDKSFDGRNITQHKNWIRLLNCSVIELHGDLTNDARMEIVLEKLKNLLPTH